MTDKGLSVTDKGLLEMDKDLSGAMKGPPTLRGLRVENWQQIWKTCISLRSMLNEFDVLQDVSKKLAGLGIPYMLTGSLAMNYYSQPRMTRDIDIVIEAQPEDVNNLVSIFEPDYYVDGKAVARAIAHKRAFNIIHHEAFIKVDCIIKKPSTYREVEFDRRQKVTIQAFPVWLVSKEDLIISKLDWARDSRSELQLGDVKNLLASGYDVEYLARWTKDLGLGPLLDECLND